MTLPRDELREALRERTAFRYRAPDCKCGNCQLVERTLLDQAIAALSSSPPEAKGEPVAWRWRPLGGETWIYDPAPEWLESQGDAIEKQPLYAAPSLPASPPDGKVAELLAKLPDDGDLRWLIAQAVKYGSEFCGHKVEPFLRLAAHLRSQAGTVGVEVTDAMADAALKAWFAGSQSESDQGLMRSMKSAVSAALAAAPAQEARET